MNSMSKPEAGLQRLNRFIAASGIASRRKADELIAAGLVTVNGSPATLGTHIDPERDAIKVRGKLIKPRTEGPKLYLLLNKPAGFICSRSDPEGRPQVTDLVHERGAGRLFTVGRLDLNSEGLIILTDDGDFAAHVGHPSTGPQKTYHVRVRGVPDDKALERLRKGLAVDRKRVRAESVSLLRAKANAWLALTLKEGRNRQVRKMLEAVGHPVVKLRRVSIGSLNAAGLKTGQYRRLTEDEIRSLSGGS